MNNTNHIVSFQNEHGRTPHTGETLVTAAAGGELEAFNELVLQYQSIVYRHACFITEDPHLAEDIAQESFLRAFRGLHSFRGGSFRAWMLRIVTNTAYDLLRRSRHYSLQPLFPEDKEGEPLESPHWLADPAASVQAAVERNEEISRLYHALQELPLPYRNVITLIDLFDLDYQEAAQVLQVPVGTIKSRLARARMQMREKIKAWDGDAKFPGSQTVAIAC